MYRRVSRNTFLYKIRYEEITRNSNNNMKKCVFTVMYTS